jgi:apolipoprotein D and lipocalin family protein
LDGVLIPFIHLCDLVRPHRILLFNPSRTCHCHHVIPYRFLLLVFSVTLGACSTKPTNPPSTASKVDLDRYAGTWHEIARLPMPFQKAGDAATAIYGKNADGTLSVHNIATRPDGTEREIRGTATVLNPGQNSKLAVRFNTWFGPLIPVSKDGNYWILHVDPDYRQALVGTPDRQYLWILARTPTLPAATDAALVAKAQSLGFDTSLLVRPSSAP